MDEIRLLSPGVEISAVTMGVELAARVIVDRQHSHDVSPQRGRLHAIQCSIPSHSCDPDARRSPQICMSAHGTSSSIPHAGFVPCEPFQVSGEGTTPSWRAADSRPLQAWIRYACRRAKTCSEACCYRLFRALVCALGPRASDRSEDILTPSMS